MIKRLGFANVRNSREVAASVAEDFEWEDAERRLVYFCIGKTAQPKIKAHQLEFSSIAGFLAERFGKNPAKIPNQTDCLKVWGEFGEGLAKWSRKNLPPYGTFNDRTVSELAAAIEHYIEEGGVVGS